MHLAPPLARYDQDPTLADLLRDLPAGPLTALLSTLLDGPCWLTDETGQLLLGNPPLPDGMRSIPIAPEFEPIGQLHAAQANQAKLAATASMLTQLMRGVQRYRMAASVHLEALATDNATLREQQQALQQSETRYRELATSLDLQVKQQVEVIEAQQRELFTAEKLAAVGGLAAGVAHEINNPIGFIRSNMNSALNYLEQIALCLTQVRQGKLSFDQALAKYDLDFMLPDFTDLVQESIGGLDRVARIVQDLKAFSAVDSTEAMPLLLGDPIRLSIEMLGMQYPAALSIICQFGPLPQVLVAPGQVNQILFHVLHNALLATESGGEIKVCCSVIDNKVAVQVSDTGIGMPPAVLARVFEPFFTAWAFGRGKGLGLTVCRDLMQAQQGEIDIVSEPGQGTTVTLLFPVIGQP
ncbi:ATP-binding protein [Chitinivorax sp. B]|uniref:sensor histidine kinase n=1 Tax=Chitinivorax sp. B TaxID=2502235 RepID=UPI0010F56056|nr:ATP-binding protein [Chitinivorax sp. B]